MASRPGWGRPACASARCWRSAAVDHFGRGRPHPGGGGAAPSDQRPARVTHAGPGSRDPGPAHVRPLTGDRSRDRDRRLIGQGPSAGADAPEITGGGRAAHGPQAIDHLNCVTSSSMRTARAACPPHEQRRRRRRLGDRRARRAEALLAPPLGQPEREQARPARPPPRCPRGRRPRRRLGGDAGGLLDEQAGVGRAAGWPNCFSSVWPAAPRSLSGAPVAAASHEPSSSAARSCSAPPNGRGSGCRDRA